MATQHVPTTHMRALVLEHGGEVGRVQALAQPAGQIDVGAQEAAGEREDGVAVDVAHAHEVGLRARITQTREDPLRAPTTEEARHGTHQHEAAGDDDEQRAVRPSTAAGG
jgi:hypothetical protein